MLEDTPAEWTRGEYRITTDRTVITRVLPAALALLHGTHWAGQLELATLVRAARNSVCLALLGDARLVGFARVVTDLATYGYLTDVVIAPDARGAGLGEWMIRCILAHPDLQTVRRIALLTRDAPSLYERTGFIHGPGDRYYMELISPRAGSPDPPRS